VDQHAAEPTAPLVHVGRQPIYDRNGDVIAYELLFRDVASATRSTKRSAEATAQVMVSAFTEFGLNQLVGERACFINVTREFLVGELPVPFDPNQSVLEIVETVEIDEAVIEGARELVQRGFTTGAHEQLLDFATYVKVDLLDMDPVAVEEAVKRCRRYPHVQLVAARLQSEEDLTRAIELGFNYFQGHLLGHPHVVSTASLSPARVNRLNLLVTLTAAEVNFKDVVELISCDPALTFRLLQATNSAASGLTNRVSSVREAAVLLGLEKVQHWVALMLVSDLADASEEQLAVTMTRARACRTVAQQLDDAPLDAAFTVGLLSGIAELMGLSSAELAARLPLRTEVMEALTEGAGQLGAVLKVVRDYEDGSPAGLATLMGSEGAVKTYLGAVGWSSEMIRSVNPAGPRSTVGPRV
jgi:c-di-GMP-related signal transduction protein